LRKKENKSGILLAMLLKYFAEKLASLEPS
jgi:hypothetical protein